MIIFSSYSIGHLSLFYGHYVGIVKICTSFKVYRTNKISFLMFSLIGIKNKLKVEFLYSQYL